MNKPVAIDLFSGGGGLTAGLKAAGFSVCAAVECDEIAATTYSENHPEVVMITRDIRVVTADEIIRCSPTNKIDLIAACPPCQSFSSLTSKYKRKDSRDELIFEFARMVEQIKPAFIMMENVPGLAIKGKKLFTPVINKFKKIGYNIEYRVLEVADYGVPQNRKRLVVLGALGKDISIPPATHSEHTEPGKQKWRTVRDAISHLPEPIGLAMSKTCGGPKMHNWHISRDLSAINLERLRFIKPGGDRTELPEHLRPDCHKNKQYGFTNVYGRISWDKPSPTITGGCTTMSKGRFGHPQKMRTISVREAALLQTFSEDYKFSSDYIDRVCTIIGNALPPIFAEAMAKVCADSFREKND